MHTPSPWQFSRFTKVDGSPIETVQDVIDAQAVSTLKSDRAELWGVTMPGDDGPVICYTGNGPTSEANACLISALPDLLAAAKLTALCFKRANLNGDNSYLGDDEYEAWTALNAAIARAGAQ